MATAPVVSITIVSQTSTRAIFKISTSSSGYTISPRKWSVYQGSTRVVYAEDTSTTWSAGGLTTGTTYIVYCTYDWSYSSSSGSTTARLQFQLTAEETSSVDAPTVTLQFSESTTAVTVRLRCNDSGYTITPTSWAYRLSTASTYTTISDAYGESRYTLEGLTPGATYYFRVYYKWSYGSYTDTSGTFVQDYVTTESISAPSVSIAVSKSATTATLTLTNESRGYTVSPAKWTLYKSGSTTALQTREVMVSDEVDYNSWDLTGLTKNTTYTVTCAYTWSYNGNYSDGTVSVSFTTSNPSAPTVDLTVTPAALTATATISCSSSGYTIAPTTWAYKLSTASDYTKLDDAYGESSYTLTGLTHSTAYVLRVYYAWTYDDYTDSSGSYYQQVTFTTTKLARTYFSWKNGLVSTTPTEDCPFSAGDEISTWVTAKRWGQLQSNIQLVQQLKGQTVSSFTSVSSGDGITAALFNELVKAITDMNGYSYSTYAATAGSTQITVARIWALQTSINAITTS